MLPFWEASDHFRKGSNIPTPDLQAPKGPDLVASPRKTTQLPVSMFSEPLERPPIIMDYAAYANTRRAR